MGNCRAELLRRFDREGIAIDEHEIVRFIEDAHPDRVYSDEVLFELIAFDLKEYPTEKDSKWELFLGPNWLLPDGKGGMGDLPAASVLSTETIAYWKRRANEAINPMMKARYADLVWTLEETVSGESGNYKYAMLAIDSYINTAIQKAHHSAVRIIDKLERALSLAFSLGDKNRVQLVADEMLSFEDEIAEDNKRGLWGFSFDNLLEPGKVILADKQVEKIISDLEARLERMSILHGDGADPWAAEAAALRLARYYRRKNLHEDKHRVMRKTYSAFQNSIDHKDYTRALAWLQHMYDLFIEFEMNDDANEVTVQIAQVGAGALREQKKHEISYSISGKEMEAFLDNMTRGDLDDSLLRLIARYLPKRKIIENQLEGYSKKFFSLHLSSTVLQDFKGRPIATIGSIDSDWEGHLVSTISRNMGMSSIFLELLIDKIIKKFDVTSEGFCSWILQSPIVEEYQYGIICRGIEAYFSQDYISSMHLLIPQLEAIIRNLTENMGQSVFRKNKYGGFLYRTLGELIGNGCIRELFNEDVELYLTVLLTDQRGWNLRNTVCHGLNPTEYFGRIQCDRVIHAMLLLSAKRERTNGESQ